MHSPTRLETHSLWVETRSLWVVATCALVLIPLSASAKTYPWQKPPGPIAGNWTMSCVSAGGTVVAITIDGANASGAVVTPLGNAKTRGYTVGEVILRLEVNDFGAWVGKLLWRSAAGARRWDPIYFIATTQQLNATMTTDDCFKKMSRAR